MEANTFITQFKQRTGRLPSQVELTKELKISPDKAVRELVAYTRGPKDPPKKSKTVPNKPPKNASVLGTPDKKDYSAIFLRVVLSLLALMSFTLSVYFTALWFIGKFHWVISGLISLSMVLFMVISPQTIRYIDNRLVRLVVYISFLIALCFSMGSTISGQYNMTTKNIEASPDRAAVNDLLTIQSTELLMLIKEAQADKVVHQETLRQLSETVESRTENWQSVATERNKIDAFDERIDSLRLELKGIRDKQLDNGLIEEERDFYLFISELLGIEKQTVEFWVSALPAVFIDIISALCLNLALFIKPRR